MDYINDDVYFLRDIISDSATPVLFNVIRVVRSAVAPKVQTPKASELPKDVELKINNPMDKFRSKSIENIRAYEEKISRGEIEPHVSLKEFTDSQSSVKVSPPADAGSVSSKKKRRSRSKRRLSVN